MSFWSNVVKIGGTALAIAGGVGVTIATGGLAAAPILAGLAVAGAGTGAAIAIGNTMESNDALEEQRKKLQDQERLEAITMITGDEALLRENLGQITEKLGEIDKINLGIDANQSKIEANNEWLAMYQGLLNGEDNLLSQEKTVLENNISQATASKEIAEQQLVQQQNAANAYLQSSELEKEAATRKGFMSYAELMRQKSLANVMAGATGGVQSAFTANALSQQNEIKRLIGDDLKFNVLEDASGTGAGTFAKEFMALKSAIESQVMANQIGINAAQMNIDSADNSIKAAELDLNKTLDAWDTRNQQLEFENEDMTNAIKTDKETVERYTLLLDTYQSTAINALKEYQSQATKAGKSESDINATVETYKKNYKAVGYSIA